MALTNAQKESIMIVKNDLPSAMMAVAVEKLRSFHPELKGVDFLDSLYQVFSDWDHMKVNHYYHAYLTFNPDSVSDF